MGGVSEGVRTWPSVRCRSLFASATQRGQDFLEASPYFDQSSIPLNTFKNKEPHTGKVVSVKRIVGEPPPCPGSFSPF
jgi:hypothetical protein